MSNKIDPYNNPFKDTVDNAILEIVQNNVIHVSNLKEIVFSLYTHVFGEVPHLIELTFDGTYMNTDADDIHSNKGKFRDNDVDETSINIPGVGVFHGIEVADIQDLNNHIDDIDAYRTFKGKDILDQYTMKNLVESYQDDEIAVYRNEEEFILVLGNDVRTLMYKKDHYWYAYSASPNLHQYIIDHVVLEEDDESERYFEYAVYDNRGFDTTELPVKKQDIDLSMNYNDDLPDEEIKEWITNGDSGICILFGAAGTGKTSYIRHLMWTCRDTNFMILNTSCFDAINDTSFVNMIINNRDSVVILEDCEDLLVERMSGNSRIGTLLNLSDGILGDALKLKFICTFNAKINKIDAAVLRKGRTHVKYEFKPLTKEKAKALADSLNTELPEKKGNEGYTLAEIYYSTNNLVEGNVTSKVGFNK